MELGARELLYRFDANRQAPEQVKLYGTLTGEHEAVEAPAPQAEVVQMPTPAERSRRAR